MTLPSSRFTFPAASLIAVLCGGCVDQGGASGGEARAGTLVYGVDDRVEAYGVTDDRIRARTAEAIVALVPRTALRSVNGKLTVEAPSWGEAAGLCPGERFAEQPSAAFCTGILVDWDLVLTAGHCARVLAPADIAVVFDYFYTAPGTLEVGADVRTPIAIVAEALDPDGLGQRLDYAWFRLDRAAAPPRRPAPVYVTPPAVAVGDPLISISAGGGVPLKVDAGGHVRERREATLDYFVADTDTTHGSSGGGAFDAGGNLALLGVLARGGEDLVQTETGCARLVHEPDGAEGAEQFTYAHRAVEALCAQDPNASALCRPACGAPCEPLPPPLVFEGGCSLGGSGPGSEATCALLLALLARGRRRRAGPPPPLRHLNPSPRRKRP